MRLTGSVGCCMAQTLMNTTVIRADTQVGMKTILGMLWEKKNETMGTHLCYYKVLLTWIAKLDVPYFICVFHVN